MPKGVRNQYTNVKHDGNWNKTIEKMNNGGPFLSHIPNYYQGVKKAKQYPDNQIAFPYQKSKK